MSITKLDPYYEARLVIFGRNVRRARQISGISQQRLSELSGVSQSVISRLERGKAPRLTLDRLLQLHGALGSALPLGECPHDHSCIWRPLTATGQRSHTEALASGLPYWERLQVLRQTFAAHIPGAAEGGAESEPSAHDAQVDGADGRVTGP